MKGVVYLLLGDKHMVPLVVSMYTLRQHYTGPIVLCLDKESPITNNLVRDAGISIKTVRPNASLQYPALVLKTELWQLINELDSFLFLDADTMVCSDPSLLIPDEDDDRIILTQHSNWTTNHQQAAWRIHCLRERGYLHPDLAKILIDMNAPSINTGVFAMSKKCKVAPLWSKTVHGLDDFWLHDEISMQVLYPFYPNRVYDDRYNCNPAHAVRDPKEVVIWHCCLRKYGLPKSSETWFKMAAEVWEQNFASIRDWYVGNFDLILGRLPG